MHKKYMKKNKFYGKTRNGKKLLEILELLEITKNFL